MREYNGDPKEIRTWPIGMYYFSGESHGMTQIRVYAGGVVFLGRGGVLLMTNATDQDISQNVPVGRYV